MKAVVIALVVLTVSGSVLAREKSPFGPFEAKSISYSEDSEGKFAKIIGLSIKDGMRRYPIGLSMKDSYDWRKSQTDSGLAQQICKSFGFNSLEDLGYATTKKATMQVVLDENRNEGKPAFTLRWKSKNRHVFSGYSNDQNPYLSHLICVVEKKPRRKPVETRASSVDIWNIKIKKRGLRWCSPTTGVCYNR